MVADPPQLFLCPLRSHHHHFRYHLTPQGFPAPMSTQIPSLMTSPPPGDPLALWGVHLVALLSASATTSQRRLRKLCHVFSYKGCNLPSPHPRIPHQVCHVLPPLSPSSVCYHLGHCVVTHIGAVNPSGICGSHFRPVRQRWEFFALFRT